MGLVDVCLLLFVAFLSLGLLVFIPLICLTACLLYSIYKDNKISIIITENEKTTDK